MGVFREEFYRFTPVLPSMLPKRCVYPIICEIQKNELLRQFPMETPKNFKTFQIFFLATPMALLNTMKPSDIELDSV